MSGKVDILLTSLVKFYDAHSNRKRLFEIVNGAILTSQYVDWFVTDISRRDKIVISNTSIWQSHNDHLKDFGIYYFDPFYRKNRRSVLFNNGIETTIAQLNYYRWIFNNDIDTYLKDDVRTCVAYIFRAIFRSWAAQIIQRRWLHYHYCPSNSKTMAIVGRDFKKIVDDVTQ